MDNRTNKELIEIANSLDINGDNDSFYGFVNKYIEAGAENDQLTTVNILEVIKSLEKYCSDAYITDENVKVALGIDGKKGNELKKWCRSINDASTILNSLSLSELRYVMAEAFRLCKIHKSEKDRNWKNNKSSAREYMQTESKTKPKEKEYFCSNKKCQAKLNLTEEQKKYLRKATVLNGVICPKCKKKNQVRP